MNMKGLHKIFIVARQHFRNTALTRGFLVATIIGPVFIVAVSVLPTVFAQSPFGMDQQTRVAIVTSGIPAGLPDQISAQLTDQGGHIDLLPVSDEEAGRQLLIDEKVNAYIEISSDLETIRYFSNSETEYQIRSAIRSALGAVNYQRKLQQYNISPKIAADLTRSPDLQLNLIGKDGQQVTGAANPDSKFLLIITLSMMLYMTIMFYGQIIGRSVVLEKTSKTIELMMSSVTSTQLMLGKIFGIGMAGVFQYLIWITATLGLGSLAYRFLGISLPAGLSLETFSLILLFFVLGFLLYSAFFSAIGASSRDEQQVGQMGLPIVLFLVLPIMMFVPITMNPGSNLALGMSYFPMTSPMVMVMRSISSTIPPLQMVISALILLISILLVGLLAAKIFRTGILMTGKKVSLKEVLRWLKN